MQLDIKNLDEPSNGNWYWQIWIYETYRSRTHLWQRDPPYVLDTVFRRFDILLRSSGREGV